MSFPYIVQEVITSDGSHTIAIPALNEHFHSVNGAVAESEHVFVRSGLRYAADLFTSVELLEVGFGTGLNSLLSFIFADNNGITLNYTAIEPYPLPDELIAVLNYPEVIQKPKVSYWWENINDVALWDEFVMFNNKLSLCKHRTTFDDFVGKGNKFNLVYFDLFAPAIQSELWTAEVFSKVAGLMEDNGVLVTYSSKGEVRRNLKSVGFKVEKIAGPSGKREIVRAFKLPL